jgi:hypothetical protein
VKYLWQGILIVATLLSSWLGMQAIHELGHALAAWFSGASGVRVVLHPLTISRTDVVQNPHPLLVVWAGPVLGVLLPFAVWRIAAWRRLPGTFVLRFFAGFCLVANGAYVAFGSIDRVGDCGVMLKHGSPVWLLWLFGALTVPAGFWLWHGQGRHFGLGPAKQPISRGVVGAVLLALLALLLLGFLIDGK